MRRASRAAFTGERWRMPWEPVLLAALLGGACGEDGDSDSDRHQPSEGEGGASSGATGTAGSSDAPGTAGSSGTSGTAGSSGASVTAGSSGTVGGVFTVGGSSSAGHAGNAAASSGKGGAPAGQAGMAGEGFGGEGGDEPAATLVFGECPEDLPGVISGRECATARVPLRWEQPDGDTVEVMVARYRIEPGADTQLWLLDGGPGGTGATFMDPGVLALYRSLGAEIYIPQHRGTGHSTPLGCPNPDDFGQCGAEVLATWGEGLRGFHSAEAGRDLGYLIGLAGSPDTRVFVLGTSYGTYWARRYLQAFPTQATGVILDSVLPFGKDVETADREADQAARSIFALCRDTPECAAAFEEEDPEVVAERVLDLASSDPEGRCMAEGGPDRAEVSSLLTRLVDSAAAEAVPGVVRRLARCNAQDQAELTVLAELAGTDVAQPGVDWASANPALGLHIIRTDIMADVVTFPLGDVLQARDSLVFWSVSMSPDKSATLVQDWPVHYAAAPSALPELSTPILLMSGGLDLHTPPPWAREVGDALAGMVVEFPYIGHEVDYSLAALTDEGLACSQGIKSAFMDEPTSPIDTSCASTAYLPDVAGLEEDGRDLAMLLFGTTALLGED